MEQKELNLHAQAYGNLMGNILSLEFLLRLFLLQSENDPMNSFHESDKLNELKNGEKISINAFTKLRYFKMVVEHYNKDVRIEERGLTINNNLVGIRNALAHGMIWGENPSPPLRLLHFDKGIVKLNVLLTIEWFNEQIRQVRLAIENVEKAIKLLERNKL